jgi:hypothetical protein
MDSIFDMFVPTYFEVGDYEIIILQNPEGDLITLKITEYGKE